VVEVFDPYPYRFSDRNKQSEFTLTKYDQVTVESANFKAY
jgi:hypothetical protein